MQRSASEWMRIYFRHARTLNRHCCAIWTRRRHSAQLEGEVFSAARSVNEDRATGYGRFRGSRRADRSVEPAGAFEPPLMYSMFVEAARTGTPLSREAERSIRT